MNSLAYPNAQAFDKDLCQLFANARKWIDPRTPVYSDVLALQRIYQELSKATEAGAAMMLGSSSIEYADPIPVEDKTVNADRIQLSSANYKGEALVVGTL